jgi:hypothetical protein
MGEIADTLPEIEPISIFAEAPAHQKPFSTFDTLPPASSNSIQEYLTALAKQRFIDLIEDHKSNSYDHTKTSLSYSKDIPHKHAPNFDNLTLSPSQNLSPTAAWIKKGIDSYTEHRFSECGYNRNGLVCGPAIQNLELDEQLLSRPHTFVPLFETKHENLSFSFGFTQDYNHRNIGKHLMRTAIGAQPYLNDIKENLREFGKEHLGPLAIQAYVVGKQLKNAKPTGVAIQITGSFDLSKGITTGSQR